MASFRPLLVFVAVFILLALTFPPPSLETLNIRSRSYWLGIHFDRYWDLRILKLASSNRRWYFGVFSTWIYLPWIPSSTSGSGYGLCIDLPDTAWTYGDSCICLPGYLGPSCTSFYWGVEATVNAIIFVNLLIYLLWKFLPRQQMYRYFIVTNDWNYRPWTLVLACFSHRTLGHLVYNMLFLNTTAQAIGRRVSYQHLLLIYLTSGVAGQMCSIVITRMRDIRYFETLGASGGIYGLLGALWALDPGVIFYMYQQRLTLPQYVTLSVLADLVLRQNQVDVAAHVGGIIAGKLLTERVLYYLPW